MKQYHFDRSDFEDAFSKVFSDSEFNEFLGKGFNYMTSSFYCFMHEDDCFILNLTTGVLIGWYKLYHVGRINFCNNSDFDLNDLDGFLRSLRNELIDNGVISGDLDPQYIEEDLMDLDEPLDNSDSESDDVSESKMTILDLKVGDSIYVIDPVTSLYSEEKVSKVETGVDSPSKSEFMRIHTSYSDPRPTENGLKCLHWSILIKSTYRFDTEDMVIFDARYDYRKGEAVQWKGYLSRSKLLHDYPKAELRDDE